jgi:nucleotide-binding universal stress UspA family protein
VSLFRRILVPIDDSPLASKALDTAFALASRFGSRVIVLYVRSENTVWNVAEQRRDEAEFEFETRAVLETALQALSAGHHPLPPSHVTVDVRTGDPLPCILEAIVEDEADLIVMGTHGRSSLTDRMLGSTTERVLVDGKVAMLVVRNDPAPAPE